MTYEFETQKKNGYILLTASGTIESAEDLLSASRLMWVKAAQFNCRRFLIDERMVAKDIDPLEIIAFAEGRADDPDNRLRVATVYTPETLSKLGWMETFLQNRSLAYRQFSSFDEAEQWLMS